LCHNSENTSSFKDVELRVAIACFCEKKKIETKNKEKNTISKTHFNYLVNINHFNIWTVNKLALQGVDLDEKDFFFSVLTNKIFCSDQ